MIFDIHSHILPSVDDGAKDMDTALQLLSMMKEQGITDVMATPHFYPQTENFENYVETVENSFSSLKQNLSGKDLPNLYLGCEMLYFDGLGNSQLLSRFCLNGSEFLLLELSNDCINDKFFKDIDRMRDRHGITPIIAHVERYYKDYNYKNLFRFLESEGLPAQINAASVISPGSNKPIKKLLKSDIPCVIASDTHSLNNRPPLLKKAHEHILAEYGSEISDRLCENSKYLYERICFKND